MQSPANISLVRSSVNPAGMPENDISVPKWYTERAALSTHAFITLVCSPFCLSYESVHSWPKNTKTPFPLCAYAHARTPSQSHLILCTGSTGSLARNRSLPEPPPSTILYTYNHSRVPSLRATGPKCVTCSTSLRCRRVTPCAGRRVDSEAQLSGV